MATFKELQLSNSRLRRLPDFIALGRLDRPIGIYLLLYLSRTREYLADSFSAGRVEPRHLASALIMIAYGIVAIEDTEATQSLLRSTRHLGVIDVKNARYTGLLAESTAHRAGVFVRAPGLEPRRAGRAGYVFLKQLVRGRRRDSRADNDQCGEGSGLHGAECYPDVTGA